MEDEFKIRNLGSEIQGRENVGLQNRGAIEEK